MVTQGHTEDVGVDLKAEAEVEVDEYVPVVFNLHRKRSLWPVPMEGSLTESRVSDAREKGTLQTCAQILR